MNLFIPSAIARWREIKALFEKGLAVSSPDFIVKNYPETGQVSLTLRVAPIAAPAAPPLVGSCIDWADTWDYYYDPFGGYIWPKGEGVPPPPDYNVEPGDPVTWWKGWCRRSFQFNYDPNGPAIGIYHVYTGADLETETTALVTLTGEAVEALMDQIRPFFDTPTDAPFSLTVNCIMYRFMQTVWLDHSKQHDALASSDCIPIPFEICWSPTLLTE